MNQRFANQLILSSKIADLFTNMTQFQPNSEFFEIDGSADFVLRTKEIAQDFKTTLAESNCEDDEFVKKQIYAAGDDLQKVIDDFTDHIGLLRSKRTDPVTIISLTAACPIPPFCTVFIGAVGVGLVLVNIFG